MYVNVNISNVASVANLAQSAIMCKLSINV